MPNVLRNDFAGEHMIHFRSREYQIKIEWLDSFSDEHGVEVAGWTFMVTGIDGDSAGTYGVFDSSYDALHAALTSDF